MTKQISVCFIINNLKQGGAERQLVELIKNIDKQKFNVTLCLYAINKGIFYTEIFSIPEIKIVHNTLRNKKAVPKILEALIYLYTFLKNNNFDIVHTTLFMNGLFVRLIAPQRYKNKIISSIRNSLKIYKRSELFIERMLIRRSYVVANTKNIADEFIYIVPAAYRERISYIYNGYNHNLFKPQKNMKNTNLITIGCIGRICYQKNQIQIVRVVHSLNITSVRLMIIGESGDQEEIINAYIRKNMLENHVILKPKQINIQDYYNSFDIFILSSIFEGCPNVLFEAMLCKCFCIISVNANTDNFVIQGENGLVYDGTDGDLKEQLKYALSIMGSSTFDKIRESGYQYALNNFSMERMVKSYENLYDELLNGPNAKN